MPDRRARSAQPQRQPRLQRSIDNVAGERKQANGHERWRADADVRRRSAVDHIERGNPDEQNGELEQQKVPIDPAGGRSEHQRQERNSQQTNRGLFRIVPARRRTENQVEAAAQCRVLGGPPAQSQAGPGRDNADAHAQRAGKAPFVVQANRRVD